MTRKGINLPLRFFDANRDRAGTISSLSGIAVMVASIVIVCIALMGCQQKPPKRIQRGIYYWKSAFNLTPYERDQLEQLEIKSIYTKFFDVVWNEEQKTATPTAKIQWHHEVADSLKIIPVVFVANETMARIDSKHISILANNIITLINRIQSDAGLRAPDEWQIDCDWTASTQEKYFRLLDLIKAYTSAHQRKLSATIRLYQCKFRSKTGVPPVDRGLLMCYNMGNLKDPNTNNSILDVEELKKYITSLSTYPLALDIALPLFDWKVLYRQNQYAGLISGLPDSALTKLKGVRHDGNRFAFSTDVNVHQYTFKAGDMLRDEQSDYTAIRSAAELLNKHLKASTHSVLLYHLDSITLSKYSLNELETMFGGFH